MAISHINDKDIENEPLHTDFIMPISFEYLISHNINFDIAVIKNVGSNHEPKLIYINSMLNYLLSTLESYKLVFLLCHFYRNVARA